LPTDRKILNIFSTEFVYVNLIRPNPFDNRSPLKALKYLRRPPMKMPEREMKPRLPGWRVGGVAM
jgi:hypothetical protein